MRIKTIPEYIEEIQEEYKDVDYNLHMAMVLAESLHEIQTLGMEVQHLKAYKDNKTIPGEVEQLNQEEPKGWEI